MTTFPGHSTEDDRFLKLRAENDQLRLDLQQALAELRFLRGERFARSSERQSEGQISLFNEAEELAGTAKGQDESSERPARGARRKKKKPIPDGMRRIEHLHDLPESERHCADHGPLERTGSVVKEQLEFVPARYIAHRHVCAVYRCAVCDARKTAEMAISEPIPGSIASASLLAQIATAKYVDHAPLYRQEKIMERDGIFISRTTLATWMIKAAALLTPIVNLLRETALSHDILQMDETPVQVLSVEGRKPTSKSYMWVMCGGSSETPVVVFNYDPSRSQSVPLRLLDGYVGYLQVDGYKGYGKVCDQHDLSRVGCLMHIRRGFHEAHKRLRAVGGEAEIAERALALIRELYAVEEKAKAERMKPAERSMLRREKSQPLLDALELHARRFIELVPPKSATGKAITYCLGEWKRFVRFMDDGRIEIDNGRAERAIRPFAQGRRNWLFSDTVAGAEASAAIYSVLETAKANGVEPRAYLEHVLARIGSAQTAADVEALLPWNYKAHDSRTL